VPWDFAAMEEVFAEDVESGLPLFGDYGRSPLSGRLNRTPPSTGKIAPVV
jgi:hypothetical protein